MSATASDGTMLLRALTTSSVLDTLPEERFDRITRLTSRTLEVPMALVSLADRERRWVKSRHGLDGDLSDRWLSLCEATSRDGDAVVIADAREHAHLSTHPLVATAPALRFFASHAIRGPDGSLLGTLCIADTRPRELSPEDTAVLADFAALVDHEISLIANAATDELTRLSNRRGFLEAGAQVLALCRRNRQPMTLVVIDLDEFKSINDTGGHAAGDLVLREFSKLLGSQFRHADVVARLGGDEFAVICGATTADQVGAALERLERDFAASVLGRSHPRLAWSVGVAESSLVSDETLTDMLRRTDSRMYERKRSKRQSASPVLIEASRSSRLDRALSNARWLTTKSR